MARWILAGFVALGSMCEARAAPADDGDRRGDVPVLVELFTSEGCSSCPPADAVLARLEDKQPVPGALVIPLAHHVDYWDSLGWPDPFASAKATARQRSYGGNYTPQAIVDGADEMVGSKGGALERAIAEAARRPHVKVTITTNAPGDVVVTAPAIAGAEVIVALVQARARVAVPRGENAGRTLDHSAIVRETKTGPRATFAAPKGVAPSELRIVAFVQDVKSRRVLGSTMTKW